MLSRDQKQALVSLVVACAALITSIIVHGCGDASLDGTGAGGAPGTAGPGAGATGGNGSGATGNVAPPHVADACTDGVDCYCDRVQGGDLDDPKLLFCEDFESPSLYEANLPDSHYAAAGDVRGKGGYWRQTYGPAINGCVGSEEGVPSNPRFGVTCNKQLCGGAGEYVGQTQGNLADGNGADAWQMNNKACIDIVRQPEEFGEPVAGLVAPLRPDGTRGVFDGNQSQGHVVRRGSKNGIMGRTEWDLVTELGWTKAGAFSSNITKPEANLFTHPWKPDEFLNHDKKLQSAFEGTTGAGPSEGHPFAPVWQNGNISDTTPCDVAVANAEVAVGQLKCRSDGALQFGPDLDRYNRFDHWTRPGDSEWGCTRVHLTGLGTANAEVKYWFRSSSLSEETLIIHVRNLDARFSKMNGVRGFVWNAYANRNQTENVTDETVLRYNDNWHIREGQPVSCAAIGFGP